MSKPTHNEKRNNPPSATRVNGFKVSPEELVIVGLDTKDKSDHPLYDERISMPLRESFVKSVLASGVLQTVLCRKDGSSFQVIDGRQRVRAAREANKRLVASGGEPLRIPVTLRKDTDLTLAMAVVATNEHRQADLPMNRARKALRLLNHGADIDQIAAQFNVSEQTIKNWLKLHDLDPKVQKAIDAGKISASAAAPLAKLSRDRQIEMLADVTSDAPAAPRATRSAIARTIDPAKVTPPGKRALKKILNDEPSMQTLSDTEIAVVKYFTTGEVLDSDIVTKIKGLVEAFGG